MSSSTPPSISNPLRILYLSPPDTAKVQLLQADTLAITTPYYSAQISIWHDRTPLSASSINEWEAEWRVEEAGEVVRSIGAWVVAIQKPLKKHDLDMVRTLLTALSKLVTHHTSEAVDSYAISNEPLLLCLVLHQPTIPQLEISEEEWEDLCHECGGWEWIDGEAEGEGQNQFGEKVGMPRLLEALEAHEWDSIDEGADLPDDLHFDLGEDERRSQSASDILDEIESECAREPILPESDGSGKSRDERREHGVGKNDDDQVQELESMMLRLQAVKDMGADMPEAERRRLAKKAVGDVMRKM